MSGKEGTTIKICIPTPIMVKITQNNSTFLHASQAQLMCNLLNIYNSEKRSNITMAKELNTYFLYDTIYLYAMRFLRQVNKSEHTCHNCSTVYISLLVLKLKLPVLNHNKGGGNVYF
jgi:hypothetical protein